MELNDDIPNSTSKQPWNDQILSDETPAKEINHDDNPDAKRSSSTRSSDSIQHIMAEINAYEDKRNNVECKKPPSQGQLVFGCFEVVPEINISSSLSLAVDEDEEREIMKCFQTINKTSSSDHREVKKVKKGPFASKIPLKKTEKPHTQSTIPWMKHREIQSSCIEIGDLGCGDSAGQATSEDVFTKFSDSRVFYPIADCDAETVSSKASFLDEFFINQNGIDDSDTAHFTSRTITADSSPLDSPPKKVTTIAYRAKFKTSYSGNSSLLAQMEPLSILFNESPEESDDLPTDGSRKLSRFPVRCPITNCETMSVPSDFCNHITIDHPYIDIIR